MHCSPIPIFSSSIDISPLITLMIIHCSFAFLSMVDESAVVECLKILNNSELGALGISYLIHSYLHKKDLKNLINDHQNIGHIHTPQRKHSKYLHNKYQKYKKLRESLNNIW